MAIGHQFTCGIYYLDSTVYCAGRNDFGQLGTQDFPHLNYPTTPVGGLNAPISPFSALFCSGYSCMGLLNNGSLISWGGCWYGNCGRSATGATRTRFAPALVPAPAGGSGIWSTVSHGSYSTCAIESVTALVYCWGAHFLNGLQYALGVIGAQGPSLNGIPAPTLLTSSQWPSGIQALSVHQQGAGGGGGIFNYDPNNYGAVASVVDVDGKMLTWGASARRQQGYCDSSVWNGWNYGYGPARPCFWNTTLFSGDFISSNYNGGICASTYNSSSRVACWGRQVYSVFGTSSVAAWSMPDYNPFPVTNIIAPSGLSWKKLALGVYTSCGIDVNMGMVREQKPLSRL